VNTDNILKRKCNVLHEEDGLRLTTGRRYSWEMLLNVGLVVSSDNRTTFKH
jgi:hypothetical protein